MRTGTPCAARYSLAWGMVKVPKWKIDAASTALAWPSTTPSTRSSMDRDGTKSGFDLKLTRSIADAVDVPVIASGGVGSLQDLVDGVVDGHASAVLAASIFHFGTFTIPQAKDYLAAHGVPVRMDAVPEVR